MRVEYAFFWSALNGKAGAGFTKLWGQGVDEHFARSEAMAEFKRKFPTAVLTHIEVVRQEQA